MGADGQEDITGSKLLREAYLDPLFLGWLDSGAADYEMAHYGRSRACFYAGVDAVRAEVAEHLEEDHRALQRVWALAEELDRRAATHSELLLGAALREFAAQIRYAVTGEFPGV
jgi:hypothetical protein